jgi:hypothetical protein
MPYWFGEADVWSLDDEGKLETYDVPTVVHAPNHNVAYGRARRDVQRKTPHGHSYNSMHYLFSETEYEYLREHPETNQNPRIKPDKALRAIERDKQSREQQRMLRDRQREAKRQEKAQQQYMRERGQGTPITNELPEDAKGRHWYWGK